MEEISQYTQPVPKTKQPIAGNGSRLRYAPTTSPGQLAAPFDCRRDEPTGGLDKLS